ncbi:hypothetical protein GCM10023159_25060 [Brevibacterium yomogidense]
MSTYRNDHSYVQRRDALRRVAMKKDLPCHLCGERIDYGAVYTDRRAFTADHVEAVGAGGSMTGVLKPSHRACNSRRGAKPLAEYLAGRVDRPRAGGAWW